MLHVIHPQTFSAIKIPGFPRRPENHVYGNHRRNIYIKSDKEYFPRARENDDEGVCTNGWDSCSGDDEGDHAHDIEEGNSQPEAREEEGEWRYCQERKDFLLSLGGGSNSGWVRGETDRETLVSKDVFSLQPAGQCVLLYSSMCYQTILFLRGRVNKKDKQTFIVEEYLVRGIILKQVIWIK